MVSTDAAVVSSKDDKLGFKDYAKGVIAPVERLSKENTPFTIGIFGGWGSGKTSFMKIMQESLESRGYKTIFFNSWEYGNEEKPWIPFMIKIVDELFYEDIVDVKKLIQNIFLFSTDVVLRTYSQEKISTGIVSDLVKKSKTDYSFREWSDEDAKIVVERLTKVDDFKKKIKRVVEEPPCLFSWNKIPGWEDNEKLRRFLNRRFDIEWVKTANIEKIDDSTIRVFDGKRLFNLNKIQGNDGGGLKKFLKSLDRKSTRL